MSRTRPPITDTQRTQVCTLLATNFSRREAARFAGCSESGIRYLEDNDREFRQQLADAERAAKEEPLGCIRAHAKTSVRAAIYLDQRNNPPRSTRRSPPCIDPRRLCRRLYNRILGLIADPNTRCAVREVLRDTYHSAGLTGLKTPARDPELRAKPLPVYPADGDHWDLQDYSPADERDRSLAADQARAAAAATAESAVSPTAAYSPDIASYAQSNTSSSAQSNTENGHAQAVPIDPILPYKMNAVLSGLGDPRYSSLLMQELGHCRSVDQLPDRMAARIGDNLRAGRAPLAKGPRRNKKDRHKHKDKRRDQNHRHNGHTQRQSQPDACRTGTPPA